MSSAPLDRKENTLRFSYMAVSGLLFLGANAAWNSLGYLNPLAWFLEWSSVVLAFLCIYSAVRTREASRLYGYSLIFVSLIISGISYSFSVISPNVQANIYASVNPLAFMVLAIPLAILILIILQHMGKLKNGKLLPIFFFVSVIGSMGFLLYSFYTISPTFPTDESVFDMYGAHLFLSGLNPYDPSLMAGSFSFYNFQFGPFDPITPLTTGGYVQSLSYPALSFLVFIPVVILHLKASLIMLPVLLAPIVIVWHRAWTKANLYEVSLSILPFLGLLIYEYQGASADTDALWATLLMLSYMFLPRVRGSGILFGLALSVKQLPIFAGPFMLYFIYREHGAKNAFLWFSFAAISFFAVNAYFILQSPGDWFSAMISGEFAPLIGIGFGIPQISFAGVFSLPRVFFTIVMLDMLIVSFVFYASRYTRIKYGMFIFPILIFLLNYRVFPQYMYYWMIVSLLPMIDLFHSRNVDMAEKETDGVVSRKSGVSFTKIMVGVLVVVLIGSVAIGYHEGVQKNTGYFSITSVRYTSYNSSGYVNGMDVEISYHGTIQNLSHVNFRIFQDSPVVNGNMYIWVTGNDAPLLPGNTYNLTVYPEYPAYSLNLDVGSMVVAYYGNIQGSFYIKH